MPEILRESLLASLNVAKAALATKSYLPALTHFCFTADGPLSFIMACNGTMAIEVAGAPSLGADICVPGDLLLKAISTFSQPKIKAELDNTVLTLSAGRSRLKMPILPAADFPFSMPPNESGLEVPITEDMIKGILQCLPSAGIDGNHMEMMGVTITIEDGFFVLYSSNNVTLSRYRTSAKATKLPNNEAVFLPSDFCNRLCGLARGLESRTGKLLFPVPGESVMADLGRVTIYSKLPADLQPVDFHRVIHAHVDLTQKPDVVPIPDAFEQAMSRAALLLNGESVKTCRASISQGVLSLSTKCKAGAMDDELPLDADDRKAFGLDPELVLRSSKHCTHIGFTRRAMVMTNGEQFIHLITLY